MEHYTTLIFTPALLARSPSPTAGPASCSGWATPTPPSTPSSTPSSSRSSAPPSATVSVGSSVAREPRALTRRGGLPQTPTSTLRWNIFFYSAKYFLFTPVNIFVLSKYNPCGVDVDNIGRCPMQTAKHLSGNNLSFQSGPKMIRVERRGRVIEEDWIRFLG